jgi:hypothetical protein
MQLCDFQLKSLDGDEEIGRISKQWSGLMKEWFTKADNFGVTCKYILSMQEISLGN